jgi:hypothetical protein
MILLNSKSFDQLQAAAKEKLTELGFSTAPGAIAKLFLSIVNRNIADLYDVLTLNHVQAFVSTATDEYLDAIGRMLACDRLTGESNDDYRYRICNQVLNSATANETAIRLAALSTEGVQDVVLKKFSFGSGSFSVMIITDSPTASDALLEVVRINVEQVAGYGVKFNVTNPDIKTVKIKIKLLTKDNISTGVSQDVKFYVRDALKEYFTTRKIGESIYTNQITQVIMDVNKGIVSYICESFKIDGKTNMYVNQDCKWNERFMLSSDPDAIIIL